MNLQTTRNYDLQAAVLEAEGRFATANPRSKGNFEAACKAMPGGNTRTVLFYAPYPLTIAKAEGCYVTDLDGHAYADFLGEYTAGLYGHSHPVIKKAIVEGLERGIVLGGHNEIEVKLATEVCRRWGMERLRFTNSGTEGNLMAINAARAFTGRSKIMVFEHGYHGGVLSAKPGGSPTNSPYDMIYAKFNDTAGSRKLIAENAKDLACVIIEPMMGGAGCLPADKEFLQALRDETKTHGVMFILDEVVTSRLAPGGAQQIYGIKPDLMSFGKYIGGGLSFGGFGGRAEIMDHFDPRLGAKAWPHAGTFNQNQLTMSAGYAGITQVFTADVCIAFNKKGDAFRARLQEIAKKRSLPITLTGMGSVMMVHFCDGPVRTPDDANRSNALARDLMHLDMLGRSIYMTRRGMVNMSLPMGDKEFDAFASAFDAFLGERAALLAKV